MGNKKSTTTIRTISSNMVINTLNIHKRNDYRNDYHLKL